MAARDKTVAAVLLLLSLPAACAHRTIEHPIKLPDATEVGGYVAANWKQEFNQRFGRFAGRTGQSSDLISVQNVHCELRWSGTIAECSYDVTASFGRDEKITRQLWSQFERNGVGFLNETIVVWHELRR